MTTPAGWIAPSLLGEFQAEGTDAHRLATASDGWVERFGPDVLISYKSDSARDRLGAQLREWEATTEFRAARVFGRFLPRKNEERVQPQLITGNSDIELRTIATEAFLKYWIDFEAGYSVGLFVD